MAAANPVLTADERIALVSVKIDRAKKHIAELNGKIHAFINVDPKPYEILPYHDTNANNLIYNVSRVTPIPECFSAITGDAIQNLRSSLDHLVCQLWDVAKPGISAPTRLQFPTDSSPAQYVTSSITKIKGLRQDAIDLINSIEPYNGGIGQDFAVLNRLNTIDKHRLLIAVGSAFQSVYIATQMAGMSKSGTIPKTGITVKPGSIIFPLKQGDELLVYPFDPKVEKYLNFTFGVVMHEPGVIEGKPVLETLQHFSDLVSSTVASFKPCLS